LTLLLSIETTMDHITRERLEELAGPSAGYDLEATAILSPEESVHLAECPKCVDLFVETVREKVRRRQDESPPET